MRDTKPGDRFAPPTRSSGGQEGRGHRERDRELSLVHGWTVSNRCSHRKRDGKRSAPAWRRFLRVSRNHHPCKEGGVDADRKRQRPVRAAQQGTRRLGRVKEGHKRASQHFATKEAAINRAREMITKPAAANSGSRTSWGTSSTPTRSMGPSTTKARYATAGRPTRTSPRLPLLLPQAAVGRAGTGGHGSRSCLRKRVAITRLSRQAVKVRSRLRSRTRRARRPHQGHAAFAQLQSPSRPVR